MNSVFITQPLQQWGQSLRRNFYPYKATPDTMLASFCLKVVCGLVLLTWSGVVSETLHRGEVLARQLVKQAEEDARRNIVSCDHTCLVCCNLSEKLESLFNAIKISSPLSLPLDSHGYEVLAISCSLTSAHEGADGQFSLSLSDLSTDKVQSVYSVMVKLVRDVGGAEISAKISALAKPVGPTNPEFCRFLV